MTERSSPETADTLEQRIREYADDLRRNSSGGDEYEWVKMRSVADYLETLIKRSSRHAQCAPIAWRYERSHATVDPASQPDDWIDWHPHLDFEKPRYGRDIRNVTPLYALTSTDSGTS